MKLYKFRSFNNHTLDILIHERLYCGPYHKLNDPLEGLFATLVSEGGIARSVARPVARSVARSVVGGGSRRVVKRVEDLPGVNGEINVCSLSAEFSNIRMWSHYADGHRGVAIEVDIPEDCQQLVKVNYEDQLQKFQSNLLKATTAYDVLSFKTKHWEHEREYRVIQAEEYFCVKGKIMAVYLGINSTSLDTKILERVVGSSIPIHKTVLDTRRIEIHKK